MNSLVKLFLFLVAGIVSWRCRKGLHKAVRLNSGMASGLSPLALFNLFLIYSLMVLGLRWWANGYPEQSFPLRC